jgi:hypothetical protein
MSVSDIPGTKLSLRSGIFSADSTVHGDTLTRLCAALDLLFHCSPLSTLLLKAEAAGIDLPGSDQERAVFGELRRVFAAMRSSTADCRVQLLPLIERLSAYANNDYRISSDAHSLQNTWDDIVSIILAVNPPLWEVFLGSGSGLGVNVNLGSSGAFKTTFLHCYKALFCESKASIEDVFRSTASKSGSKVGSAFEKTIFTNAMTLKRTPLLLVISTEHINNNGATIKFSESLDLNSLVGEGSKVREDEFKYDLVGIAVSDASQQDKLQYYFRSEQQALPWIKGQSLSGYVDSLGSASVAEELLVAHDRKGASSLHVYARRDQGFAFKRILSSLHKSAQVVPPSEKCRHLQLTLIPPLLGRD